MKMTAVLLCGNGFCRSPRCGRRPSFTGLFLSFGSDPCFPAPAHDQYLSCGSLRHAVWCFRRLYHIGDQEYHRLRFVPRFPRLDDRRLPVRIPVQPYEKTVGSRPWRIRGHIAHRRPCLLSVGRSLYGVVKRSFFYISLFSVSCGAGCLIAFIVLKGIHIFQTNTIKKNNISFKIDFPRPSGLFLLHKMMAARLLYTICMYN